MGRWFPNLIRHLNKAGAKPAVVAAIAVKRGCEHREWLHGRLISLDHRCRHSRPQCRGLARDRGWTTRGVISERVVPWRGLHRNPAQLGEGLDTGPAAETPVA
jgi:hypothetical protein